MFLVSQKINCSLFHPQSRLVTLQLGHAGEGVEMINMNVLEAAIGKLQLGRAGEGVEIVGGLPIERLDGPLQLGHAGEGVEISSDLSRRHKRLAASIGPRR